MKYIILEHHPKDNIPHIVKVSVDTLDLMDKMKIGLIQEQSPLYRIIEPIPLTPEILKKNGFKQTSKREYIVVDRNYNYLLVDYYDPWFAIGNASDEEGEWQAFADIRFVHELQNALKLLGINIEIKP